MGSSLTARPSRLRSLIARRSEVLLFAFVLFCAAMVAHAQTVSTIYNFADSTSSGATPWYVTLMQGTNGAFYGTTYNGGLYGYGAVFSVTTSGTESLLYSFRNGNFDGAYPTGGLTLGTDGNFYGTTMQGGNNSQGIVFKLSNTGVLKILHNFNSAYDGAFPWGPPIQASDGNFYGTTSGGGRTGNGIVYKITNTGTLSVVYNFDVFHGFSPIAPPTQGTDGYLYIPVSEGGNEFCGTIVKMTTAGAISNTYSFPCAPSGGSFPIGPLVQAANGNFYSTTQDGGTNGEGTIYQVTTGLVVTVLHSFGATFGDGTSPSAGLFLGTDGNYYGTTSAGGTYADGILFNTSTGGTYTDLYSFNNSANQMQMSPLSPPVQGTDGSFYGVTEFGGSNNDGTVYNLNMGLAPFVNTPLFNGKAGETILILGTHLKGTSDVTFNGIPAAFKVISDTHMSATIPAGATSGTLRVTTPGGVLLGRKNFIIKR